MKKFLVLLMSCLILAMCLTACEAKEETSGDDEGGKKKTELTLDDEEDETGVEETEAPTEETTPEPTEEPTPEPTEAPTPEPTEAPTPEPTEPLEQNMYSLYVSEVGEHRDEIITLFDDVTNADYETAVAVVDLSPGIVWESSSQEEVVALSVMIENMGIGVRIYKDGEIVYDRVKDAESEENISPEDGSEQLSYSVYLEDVGSEKVKVIKVIRDELGYGLKEAKDLVDVAPVIIYVAEDLMSADDLCNKLAEVGSTATIETFANPVVGENPKAEAGEDVNIEAEEENEGEDTGTEKPAEEMNEDAHYIVLEDVGAEKVKVIKVLREVLGIGLKEAKDLADNPPIEIYMTEEWNEANSICSALDEVGATAYIYSYNQIMEFRGNKESEEPADDTDASEIIMEYSVEDVFYITDRGCAITGTVEKGTVRTGDAIIVILEDSTEIPAVVSELECFREIYQEASEGDNVAIYIKDGDRKLLETAVKIIIRAE